MQPRHSDPQLNPPANRSPARDEGDLTYHGQPVLKAPVWIWAVPLYFYVGGVTGGAMAIGAAAQLADNVAFRRFSNHCYRTASAAALLGTGLLIYDLGRPERFLYMLRVVRLTSPMNVGAWILAKAAGFASVAALLSSRQGALGRMGQLCGSLAGLLGLPLAGYTGVLVASSAVPVWQAGRRSLPPLFLSSAFTSSAAVLEWVARTKRERRFVQALGTVSKLAELGCAEALQREAQANKVPHRLGRGLPGVLLTSAKVLTGASVALGLFPRTRKLAAGLATAGAICLRFGIFQAGKASAKDPRETFRQQRQRLEDPRNSSYPSLRNRKSAASGR